MAADDGRGDVRHAREPEPDAAGEFAARLNRSEADTMSLDELISGRLVRHAATAPLSLLRAGQRRLRDRLGPQPRFPLDAQRVAHADQQRAERHLATARAEREAAATAAAGITRRRRLLHPRECSELDDALERSMGVETDAERWLNRADQRCAQIDTEMAEWRDWRADHAEDLASLRAIDAAIYERTRSAEATISRTLDRAPQVEPDLGIDLGP